MFGSIMVSRRYFGQITRFTVGDPFYVSSRARIRTKIVPTGQAVISLVSRNLNTQRSINSPRDQKRKFGSVRTEGHATNATISECHEKGKTVQTVAKTRFQEARLLGKIEKSHFERLCGLMSSIIQLSFNSVG